MKKVLLLSSIFILFFCIGLEKKVHADAYYNPMELYESYLVEKPFATVLPEGYYLIGTYPYTSSKDNFKGDFTYYHIDNKDIVDIEDIKKTGPLDLPENIIQSDLIDEFNCFFDEISIFGASVVKVNSSAVFFTDLKDSYTLTVFTILTAELNSNPSIAGNKHHFTSIDHPISLEDLKARYTAEDNVDKNISNRIIMDTNYDPEHRRLGSYYVSIKVSDSAMNETSIFDIIECKDFIPPTISFLDQKQEITIEVNTDFKLEDAQKHFLVSDNYDQEKDIKKYYTDIDNYLQNHQKLGTYRYKLLALDSDGSSNEAVLHINIVDRTKPTITLKGGGDTIYSDHVLQTEEILALFDVSDNYYNVSPADLKIISNTCEGIEGTEYLLTLSLTDGSNNTQEKIFKYYLNDTHSPIIRVEKTLFLPLGKQFTNSELLNMLKDAGIISQDAIDVSFSYDISIIDNEGCYTINFIETTQQGDKIEGSVTLNVFAPIQPNTVTNTKNCSNYYWLLLLIIPIIGGVPLIYKFKKHEKI